MKRTTLIVLLCAAFSLWGLFAHSLGLCFLPALFQLFECEPISTFSRVSSCRLGTTAPPTAGIKYHAAAPPAALIPLYFSSTGLVSDVVVECAVIRAVPGLSCTKPSYTVECVKLIRLYKILVMGRVITTIIAVAIRFVSDVFHCTRRRFHRRDIHFSRPCWMRARITERGMG